MSLNDYENRRAARKERLLKRAAALNTQAVAASKAARDLAAQIPLGQPILVGHHSEGKMRRIAGKIHRGHEKAMELSDQAKALVAKAAGMEDAGISADNPDAVVLLEKKLATLESDHAKLKEINKVWAKHGKPKVEPDTEATWVAIGKEAGISAKVLGELLRDLARFPWGKSPVPSYAISNSNANIRRVRERLEVLKRAEAERLAAEAAGASGDVDIATGTTADGITFQVVACFQDNRIRFTFDRRTSKETYRTLRSLGLVWSPSADAFQRQLLNVSDWWVGHALKQIGGTATVHSTIVRGANVQAD